MCDPAGIRNLYSNLCNSLYFLSDKICHKLAVVKKKEKEAAQISAIVPLLTFHPLKLAEVKSLFLDPLIHELSAKLANKSIALITAKYQSSSCSKNAMRI